MTGHVQDLWMKPGPNNRKVRSARHGKGKRWQARWLEDGREKAKAFETKEAALAWVARVAVHGPFKPRPRITFGEYAETWRKSQLHHRSRTAESTEIVFRRMLAPQLGRIPLVEVTRQDVQNAVIEWQTTYSPARVHMAYGYVATLYKSAILDQHLEVTPCRKISLPERPKKRVVPLTVEQVRLIRDAMPEHWRTAVTLAAATGVRIGELGGLTYDRIRDHTITVDRQLVKMTETGGPVFGPPKSSAGVRDVPIDDVAWAALQDHIRAHPTNPHGFVFVGRQRGPLTRGRASEAWREATDGMNLPPRTGWHSLRHFHASALIAAGLSPRAVADRLGHADVTETLGTYSHLWPSDQRRATDAIAEVLRGL